MHRHPGFYAGLNEQRLGIEITLAHLPQHRIERRHHRRNYNAVNPRRFQARHGKQIPEQHAILIHSAGLHRSHAPVGHQPLITHVALVLFAGMDFRHPREDTQHGVGIADIED